MAALAARGAPSTRSSTSPPSHTSTAASPTRRRSSTPTCTARSRCSTPRATVGGVRRFLQVSTDEVYGSIPHRPRDRGLRRRGRRARTPPARPRPTPSCRPTPTTFGVPAVITRCSNNYGPYQFPEKLIPLFVTNALDGEPLPLYGDGQNVRDWIHVERPLRGALARARRSPTPRAASSTSARTTSGRTAP